MWKTKSKKAGSRMLAMLLTLAMTLTLLPAMTFAAGESGSTGNSSVVVDKKATLEDDGTYTIELSAYATGTTTTVTEKSGVPLDIVLVLDQSGSMESNLSDLKKAVTNFINTITDNAEEYDVDHRIAVVGFAGAEYGSGSSNEYYYANTELFIGNKQYNYIENGKESTESEIASTQYGNAFQTVTNTTGAKNLSDSVAALAAKGGTHPDLGIEMANGVFNANDNSYTKADGTTGVRKRIMVMFTDGQPGDSGFDTTVANNAIAKAYTTKNTYGATVYTVGLYSNASDNITTFMNYLSSNYPTAQSMSSNNYVYTPVYSDDLDTTQTYYIIRNSSYTAVTYRNNGWKRSNSNTNYTPKTSAGDNNSSHTQFYTRTNTSTPEQSSDKYYMTTSNSAELNNIFTNITEDIQNPSTTVTLNANSVMRDVVADGFKLPENYDVSQNITIKTVAGSTADGTNITWGAETASPVGITASVDGQNVNITGFHYSEKYIAPSHPGEKLVVTIKGVEATDAAVTGEPVNTNADTSGIYATADATACIPFPQPKTILTSKTYVLDYAKPVTLASSDWKQDTLTKISGDMAKDAAAVSANYGTVTKEGNTVEYQPTTTIWNGYDSFYAFGTTTDTAIKAVSSNANGNLWSKISVIPANNVYYEDDFITSESTGTVGIEYTGTWGTDGTANGNTETANGDVQGWETSLADDTTYSGGSAHVSSTSGATAKFTFTGTGVDIYSRTNDETGTIYVTVKPSNGTSGTTQRFVVDNKANSGDYYQIPTFTFQGDYGTYEVTVRVTAGAASEGRFTYYLDGIRVYNPLGNNLDTTVQEAYGPDEINAVFTEVRSILESGAAFVDEDENGKTTSGNYLDSEVSALAPAHEIYLATDQSVVLRVSGNDSNAYYLGLKAPAGATSVAFSDAENAAATEIAHASDLYYKVTPNSDGTLVVRNTGDNLLSITKLRTAGSGENGIGTISNEEAENAVTAFKAAAVVPYNAEPATEEELAWQEQPAVPEAGEIIIENPETSEEQTEENNSSSQSWLDDLFNGLISLFGNH